MTSQTPSKPHILLIDDSVDAIEILRASLEEDADLRFALSGEEGLRMASQQPPDLILLDIEMQDFGGFRVLHALKDKEALSGIPVLFASGHRDQSIEIKAYQEGAVGFIGKPFQPERVKASVRQALKAERRDRTGARRILLATTDIRLAGSIGDLLGRAGIEMVLASDPTAIVALTSGAGFEAILLDESLTGSATSEMCRALSASTTTADAPDILVMVQERDEEAALHFIRAGCTDVIEQNRWRPLLQARMHLHTH